MSKTISEKQALNTLIYDEFTESVREIATRHNLSESEVLETIRQEQKRAKKNNK